MIPQEDIRGLKDLIHIPYPFYVYIVGAILVVALLVLGFLLLRKIFRKKETRRAETAALPYPEQILMELSELYALLNDTPGSLKRFHFLLSEIFRRYLELRFGFAATDSTTEEIAQQLPRLAHVTEPQKDAILKLLRETDAVKFADQTTSREEAMIVGEQAEAFVRSTQPAAGGPS